MARKTIAEAAQTRLALMDAGIDVFARQGYVNATLEMIAQHAQMSRGAVYWHFKGKQALLQDILDKNLLPFELFLSSGSSLHGGIHELRSAILATFEHQRSRQLCEIMLCSNEGGASLSPVTVRFRQAQSRLCDQIKQMLVRAIDRGEVSSSLNIVATCQLLRIYLAGLILECSSQEVRASELIVSSFETMTALFYQPASWLNPTS